MRVLLVVHGYPDASTGGTEIYTAALAQALARAGDAVHVLARESRADLPELGVREERREGHAVSFVNNTFARARTFADSYRNPEVRAHAVRLLERFAPDVVHVQHLTCLTTDLVEEVALRRIPCVITLNDYWLFCQRGQLLDLDYRRCDGPTPPGCARCLGPAAGAGPVVRRLSPLARAIAPPVAAVARRLATALPASGRGEREVEERLRHVRELCRQASLFLAPSQTMRDTFVGFGVPPERIVRQEQGIDLGRFAALRRVPGERLRLGFVGSLLPSKAPHLLLEAFARLPSGSAIVEVFGGHASYHGDTRYRRLLAPRLALPGVRHHGAIPPARVAQALAGLDVLVVPSIWRENAPFVIREAFAAGVPVVASELGGMRELVYHEQNGLLFRPGDAADLAHQLARLVREPALLERLRAGLPPVRGIDEDAAWTRERYRELIAAPTPGPDPRPPLAAVVLNYRTPLDAELCVRSLETSRRRPDEIVLVDNGCEDGSPAALQAALPAATVLSSPQNVGFSAGINLGIRHVLERGAGSVLLLNADVILRADAVERMAAVLSYAPGVGIVGPVLLERGDPRKVASLGIAFSAATGRMKGIGHGQASACAAPPAIAVVAAVAGCAMLVRREVFERAGLFDEAYFFSFEDIELCLRARRHGFLTALAGAAVAYHQGSGALARHSPRRLYYAARNHLRLAGGLQASLPGASIARALGIVGLNLAHALITAPAGRVAAVRAVARGVGDHLRRRYGCDGG